MQDQTKQIPSDDDRRLERAIVSQTLRDDHDRRWSRAELGAELGHADPMAIDNALTRLQGEGVVELTDETVRASRAAQRLDELGMIAV
jgi:SOS-response transcriptional repressor LexA